MRKEFLPCCFTSLYPSSDTARFSLLGVLIAVYMLAGAAVFSFLERPGELLAHQLWERRLRDFSHEHNISPEDLSSLLRHYEEANTVGIRTDRRRERWDFPGAFYFLGTVVSTIGFGMTAPSTTVGKVLLVLYGLLGCSATLLFFNLFLERVITMLGLLMRWCHRRRMQYNTTPHTIIHTQKEEFRGNEDGRKNEWKPSVYHVTLILFAAALLVACGAAALYSAVEGWSYLESLYFCFVAFSTVGFGDLVSCQREHHGDSWGYQVANCLLMFLGVCCTYSLFSAISVIIKQALNWILRTLVLVHRGMCHSRPRHRSLPKLCFCDSDLPLCFGEDDVLHGQQMQTVTSLGNNMVRPIFLSSKCLCADAKVETVCHRNVDRGITVEQVQDNCFLRKDVLTGPLPT